MVWYSLMTYFSTLEEKLCISTQLHATSVNIIVCLPYVYLCREVGIVADVGVLTFHHCSPGLGLHSTCGWGLLVLFSALLGSSLSRKKTNISFHYM